MSAIGPGDWVECVGCDTPNHEGHEPVRGDRPQRGQIYLVDRVDLARSTTGRMRPALTVTSPKAYSANGNEIGWGVENFRPIYRPKSELLESLLKRADASVNVGA